MPATSQAIAPAAAGTPTTQPKVKRELRVTGRLKQAIEQMVWSGLTRAQAAKATGMAEHSLYVAFRKPHVKAHYLSELEVLRTSERARNFHTLCEVRDQTTNQMARVNAVKALEQVDEETERKAAVRTPGVTIVIASGEQSLKSVTIDAHSSVKQAIGVPFGGESGGGDGAA